MSDDKIQTTKTYKFAQSEDEDVEDEDENQKKTVFVDKYSDSSDDDDEEDDKQSYRNKLKEKYKKKRAKNAIKAPIVKKKKKKKKIIVVEETDDDESEDDMSSSSDEDDINYNRRKFKKTKSRFYKDDFDNILHKKKFKINNNNHAKNVYKYNKSKSKYDIDDEEDEDEEEDEYDDDDDGVEFNPTQSKILPNRTILFPDKFSKYSDLDGQQIRDLMPPYANKLGTNDEYKDIQRWQLEQIKRRSEIRKDKLMLFISLVASFTRTSVNTYLNRPTGVKQSFPSNLEREIGEKGYRLTRGEQVIFNQDNPQRVIIPGAVGGGQAVMMNNFLNLKNQRHQLQAVESMDRLEIIGLAEISSTLYGHVSAAFAKLKLRLFRGLNVSDFHVMIDTEIETVRTLFAQMVAYEIMKTKNMNPTSVPLDSNFKRIQTEIEVLIRTLSQYRWNEEKKDFDDLSTYNDNSHYNTNTIYSSSTVNPLLPRYYL